MSSTSLTTRIQLSYRDDLHLLTGRWMTEATLAEFRAEYEAVLVAATQHGAWRWLLDIRRRPLPPAGSVEWLNEEFMPLAARTAPRQLCIAYLVSPLRMQAIASDERLHAAATRLQSGVAGVQVRMFGDEGEAVRWLTDCPH